MKVAFQGVRGAYSEAALLAHHGPGAEAVGFPFSEQVFDAVESGAVDAGFVPVENSIVGSVGVNTDLLLSRPVYAVAESYLLIEHCLLAKPGAKLEDLNAVYSHPIALAQCREYLKARNLKTVPEYDTAGAAELVSRRGRSDEAAIASRECGPAYGLILLARGIQTQKDNFTRFLSFVREERAPKACLGGKTSLAFSVHHHPGALLDCLQVFAAHALNLTKLESRPIAADPFQYSFFADVLGGTGDAEVKAALAELSKAARSVKVLGSYPAAERPKPAR